MLRIAQGVFFAQGLAIGVASAAAMSIGSEDAPTWLAAAIRAFVFVSATLFVTGSLMAAVRRYRETAPTDDVEPARHWPLLLGLSLALLAGVAFASASGLIPLWREIAAVLERIGFWEGLEKSPQMSGAIALPILAALFVPALESAAEFGLVAAPLALLVLLLARSRRFTALYATTVTCLIGLVAASVLAANGFSHLADEAARTMATADDIEVARAAATLRDAEHMIATTSRALVAPLLGHMAWIAFLRRARSRHAFFTAGDPDYAALPAVVVGPPARPAPSTTLPPPARPEPGVVKPSISAREHASAPARPHGRGAAVAMLTLGALILAFGAFELLRPRARFVRAEPAPGVTLAALPAAVRVTFSRALDASSALRVTRLGSASVPVAVQLARSSVLDASDSERRTLKLELGEATDGVYHVAWHSMPATGGVAGNGSFRFALGAADRGSGAVSNELEERYGGERQRRNTLTGGVVLLAFGAFRLLFAGSRKPPARHPTKF